MDCYICATPAELVTCSQCHAVVHKQCLKDWQKSIVDDKRRNSCGACRSELKPEWRVEPMRICAFVPIWMKITVQGSMVDIEMEDSLFRREFISNVKATTVGIFLCRCFVSIGRLCDVVVIGSFKRFIPEWSKLENMTNMVSGFRFLLPPQNRYFLFGHLPPSRIQTAMTRAQSIWNDLSQRSEICQRGLELKRTSQERRDAIKRLRLNQAPQ